MDIVKIGVQGRLGSGHGNIFCARQWEDLIARTYVRLTAPSHYGLS